MLQVEGVEQERHVQGDEDRHRAQHGTAEDRMPVEPYIHQRFAPAGFDRHESGCRHDSDRVRDQRRKRRPTDARSFDEDADRDADDRGQQGLPGRSSRCARGARDSGTNSALSTRAATMTGALIQNTDLQPKPAMRAPPVTGPGGHAQPEDRRPDTDRLCPLPRVGHRVDHDRESHGTEHRGADP